MRSIGIEERRRRLVRRHRLGPEHRADTLAEVIDSIVALHSTDPASVYLSVAARAVDLGVGDIEQALYDDQEVLRILGMRRTLFVVDPGLAPAIHAACTRKIAAAEHRQLLKILGDAGVGGRDVEAWIAGVKNKVLAVLDERGEASGRELSAEVGELRTKIDANPGKTYGGPAAITTLILSRMPMDGTIVRRRPVGTWLSGQYRYAPMADAVADIDHLSAAEASAVLLRRYLAAFGPVTFEDCQWWTGWTKTQTRAAIEAIELVEVDLGDNRGLVLAEDDQVGTSAPGGADEVPPVALLPALDPTVMGWKDRGWYLGDHGPRLFDRNGNAGPTVWLDGRVVGGWGQRPGGEVVVKVLEDVGSPAVHAIDQEAERLTTWLGGTVVKPRFRTPVERDLSA